MTISPPEEIFPSQAKFVALRTVAVDDPPEYAPNWNIAYGGMIETVKLFQKMVTCDLFFLDSSQSRSDEFARVLRNGGRTPVAYLGIKNQPDVSERIMVAVAVGKLWDLYYRGWKLVELAVSKDISNSVLHILRKRAGEIGLGVAIHGRPDQLISLAPDAATATEVRAERQGKTYSKFVSAKIGPLYITEYGKPSMPGKAQIDLKTYALSNRVNMTLMGRAKTSVPEFYYSVHY